MISWVYWEQEEVPPMSLVKTCLSNVHLSFSDNFLYGLLDAVRVLLELHVSQHHHSAQQQSSGVRHIFSRDVRSRPVNLSIKTQLPRTSRYRHQCFR